VVGINRLMLKALYHLSLNHPYSFSDNLLEPGVTSRQLDQEGTTEIEPKVRALHG